MNFMSVSVTRSNAINHPALVFFSTTFLVPSCCGSQTRTVGINASLATQPNAVFVAGLPWVTMVKILSNPESG